MVNMLVNYLKSMAIFALVLERGSFSKAGEHLNMPRGKVSEQVARLEGFLQVKLLQRSTRSVVVTAEGQALYRQIQGVLPSAQTGVDEVNSFSVEVKGVIRLTATPDHFETTLMPVLRKFNKTYPKIQFDLLITEEPLSIIEQGVDIAIRSGELPDSALVSIPLTQTYLKLFAGTGGKLLPRTLSELSSFPWVSLNRGQKVDHITFTNDADEQVTISLSPQHRSNNISSYLNLLENGFGVGVLAESSALELIKQGRLVEVLPEWKAQSLQLSLIYPARLHMAQHTRLLIDFIRKELC